MSNEAPVPGAEHWWPRLSIAAKHRLLADLDAPIDAETRREIESLTGQALPTRLTSGEADFIRTQIEAVD